MRPDVVLIDARWPRRALLRAQLIEEGCDVIATDDWATARTYVEALLKPRLVIVDLQDLPTAELILDELDAHIDPSRVLVLTSLGTLSSEELSQRGFHVLGRPSSVRNVVQRVSDLLKR